MDKELVEKLIKAYEYAIRSFKLLEGIEKIKIPVDIVLLDGEKIEISISAEQKEE